MTRPDRTPPESIPTSEVSPEELGAWPEVVLLKEEFPDQFVWAKVYRGQLSIRVAPDKIVPLMRRMKEDPRLHFRMLIDVTAIDYYGYSPRFEIVYSLLSLERRARVRIRALLPDDDAPAVDSLTAVWPGANWPEREVYDLFGIHFRGHPDLRRILMPEDYRYHPLRKDYPLLGPKEERMGSTVHQKEYTYSQGPRRWGKFQVNGRPV